MIQGLIDPTLSRTIAQLPKEDTVLVNGLGLVGEIAGGLSRSLRSFQRMIFPHDELRDNVIVDFVGFKASVLSNEVNALRDKIAGTGIAASLSVSESSRLDIPFDGEEP